jgi:hypothetical protein
VRTTEKTGIELLVVDNDFGGDPDGLVALAHILLARHFLARHFASPVLVTSSPLDPDLSEAAGLAPTATVSRGGKLAEQLIRLLKLTDVRVVAGAETTGVSAAQISDAAHAIAEASQRFDRTIVLCGGTTDEYRGNTADRSHVRG